MRRTLVVLLCLVAAACDHERDLVAPGGDREGANLSASVQQVGQSSTPSQSEVAAAVPGFGGYFIDAQGRPTVWLTDPAQRAAAEAALSGFLADRGYSTSELQVRQADYSYHQLDGWYRQGWPKALAVSGAVFSDLDEARNRLRFGAASAATALGIRSALAVLGIPSSAVVVDQVAPIYQLATLRDRLRPAIGGLQINFFALDASPLGYACTLGFNAVKDGVASFVTNSHCSNVQGGSELPTEYFQPVRGDANNVIGHEVDDPHYWISPDCPIPGFMCRYSDAARAAYAEGQEFALGRIARAAGSDPVTGTLDLHASNPTIRLVEEQLHSVVGETANKVGRTTGWTFGTVTETCINSVVLGSEKPIIQLCQTRVEAGSDQGDSGSPAFRLRPDGNAVLLGILWGGSVTGTPSFVFSPMWGVQRELGPLVVTDPLGGPGGGKGKGAKK